MRVPDQIRKCVFFIYLKTQASQKPEDYRKAGTGFFIGIVNQEIYQTFIYLITAKHIIEAIEKHSIDDVAYLRLNTNQGGTDYLKAPVKEWKYHPTDKTVDAAVIAFAPSRDHFDYLPLGHDMAILEGHPDYESIGVGDETFITGLFVNHGGKNRNIPILRTGNIAAMPEEPVETKYALPRHILLSLDRLAD